MAHHLLKRKVTREECPWLDADLLPGTVIYPTLDDLEVCTKNGIPVKLNKYKPHYFEIPRDAVVEQFGYEFSDN